MFLLYSFLAFSFWVFYILFDNMKVLIFNNSAIVVGKGAEKFVHKSTGEFAYELSSFGNEVEFYQLLVKSSFSTNGFDLTGYDISVTHPRTFSLKYLNYIVAYFGGIRRIIANDYIYFFYPNSFSFLIFFCILTGKPYGMYVRGEVGVLGKLSRVYYKFADSIFTVSTGFSKTINSFLPRAKAMTIKPMIAFNEKDIVLGRTYSKKDCYRILYVGRLDREKGLFELMESFGQLKSRSSLTFSLDLVGDGKILPDLESMASDLGISDSVVFHGAVDDPVLVKQFYVQADLFVLPTYHEGFPRTIYEAMIFGTPIVTTFVGAIPDLMIDGFNCYRLEVRSVDNILEKFLTIFADYSQVASIVDKATETVSPIVLASRPSHAEMLSYAVSNRGKNS